MYAAADYLQEAVQLLEEFEEIPDDFIGAVIVQNGKIIAKRHGSEFVQNNAVINAIYDTKLKTFEDCQLYISSEPNPFIYSIVKEAGFEEFYYLILKGSQKENYQGFKVEIEQDLVQGIVYEDHSAFKMTSIRLQESDSSNPGLLDTTGINQVQIDHTNDINDYEMQINNTRLRIKRTSKIDLKLFVGQIPKSWNEQKVTLYFKKFGEIIDAQIIRDPKTNQPRGCAFVKFASMSDAERAMSQCQNCRLEDQELRVKQMALKKIKWADGEAQRLGVDPQKIPKLFVGSLPKECQQENLTDVFEQYGKIEELHLIKDQDGRQKGTAIVKYEKTESALLAIRNLNAQAYLLQSDRPIEVRFAERSQQPQTVETNKPAAQKNVYIEYEDEDQVPYFLNTVNQEVSYDQPPIGAQIYNFSTQQMRTQEPSKKIEINDIQNVTKTQGPAGANIFVFHLPADYKDSDLKNLFSEHGEVISSRVITQPDGKSKGYGFVSYNDSKSAQKAIEKLNGFQVAKNKKILVKLKEGEDRGTKYVVNNQNDRDNMDDF